ncbi:MAG: hypothetical protein ACJAZ8_000076 [Planctomycetota bacterium]|jgi:hypothetical protein
MMLLPTLLLLAIPTASPIPATPAAALQQTQDAERVLHLTGSFPPGALGDLLQGLGADAGLQVAVPAKSASTWPDWADTEAWSQAAPWDAWKSDVKLQWSTDKAVARNAHRRLAILAHSQGRPEDTWAHVKHLSPAGAANLLPLLVGGMDSTQMPALIEPILPPVPVYDMATWTELPPLREYRLEGLRIGETTFTIAVQVPAEGVELRFVHESGPALNLRVRIPAPHNRTKRIEYVDWTRMESDDGMNPIHSITLVPGSEDLVLWARCMPRRLPWPKAKAGAAFPRDRNIELRTTATDPELPRLKAFAQAAADLLSVAVSTSTASLIHGAKSGPTPLRIDLAPSDFQAPKLASVISQIESQGGPLPAVSGPSK